jgi:hypothetical protein
MSLKHVLAFALALFCVTAMAVPAVTFAQDSCNPCSKP